MTSRFSSMPNAKQLVVSHNVNTVPASAYARVSADKSIAGLFMVQQTSPIGPVIDDLVLIWSATEA